MKNYNCNRCTRPILEGRAKYTMDTYGEYLCGSKDNPSYCVMFAERERKEKLEEIGRLDQ